MAIAPDETATLAAIPPALLVDAPGRPGWRLLGYDRQGACPMLADGRCSIYAVRPRTCRAYDCRVLTAAGLVDEAPPRVAARCREWEFGTEDPQSARGLAAVAAAAEALAEHDPTPRSAKDTAVLAVVLHDLFLGDEPPDADTLLRERDRRTAGG